MLHVALWAVAGIGVTFRNRVWVWSASLVVLAGLSIVSMNALYRCNRQAIAMRQRGEPTERTQDCEDAWRAGASATQQRVDIFAPTIPHICGSLVLVALAGRLAKKRGESGQPLA